MTLNVKQKRVNPDSTPSLSKSFIDKSMSSNTDKSEEEDVFDVDDDGEAIPKRSKVINRSKFSKIKLCSRKNFWNLSKVQM